MIVNPVDGGVAVLAIANMMMALMNRNIHSFLGWVLVAFAYTLKAFGV